MRPEKSDDTIDIEFDAEIYSVQAVKSAIYDLDIAAHITLSDHRKKIIQVKLRPSADSRLNLEQKIWRAVSDHQIRIDVQKEFGPFRKLILAQAFFPCENLDQILGEMDL